MRKVGMWMGCSVAAALLVGGVRAEERFDQLARDFAQPPDTARPWVYWWWLNGCVTKDGIARDLDQMKSQGISGALVFHAGEGETPWRTEFMSEAWRELFKFAVREAARRGIVIGLNLCAGWNAGGPWVKPEEAVQTLGFKLAEARGGKTLILTIPAPKPKASADVASQLRRDAGVTTRVPAPENGGYYRDIAVLAWQMTRDEKAKTTVCRQDTLVDLTDRLQGDQVTWDAPAGDWVVVRFGHYVGRRAHTKCTGGGVYLEIDPLRADVMDRHFAATAGVLIEDVKEHVGKTFQYVHIDSGEIGQPDWTPAFREEFRKRRGYDPLPYLAARAGLVVDSAEITERFNEDYERTLGDLMVDCYYGRLNELARRQGLGTHSEAAGFQKPCVDALASLGVNDICMSEFWARRSETGDNYIHQLTEAMLRTHDGIKTAAAAAHTSGRRIVQAEAFTVMRGKTNCPNWDKDPFALKDIGDRAFCAGLNRNMLCFWVSQPDEHAKPGYEWPRVGNEFDRHVTWWPLGGAWLTYLARCQSLLQAGTFVADACYFPGEYVPNYVPARWGMDPELPRGFDCDMVNAEILKGSARVENRNRLALPSGMTYRYLALNQGGRWQYDPFFVKLLGIRPPQGARGRDAAAETAPRPLAVSPATLAKIKELVEAGMTLIGPPPARAIGLTDYPASDQGVARLTKAIWGAQPSAAGVRKVGQGRVIWGKPLAEVFQADGLTPDLEIKEDEATAGLPASTLSGIPNPGGSFDWIHRRLGEADAYFIANLRNARAGGEFTFRIGGRQPELWDAVTGETRDLPESAATEDGRTRVGLRFEPRQSFFVVFRSPAANAARRGGRNFQDLKPLAEIGGPWEVSFDPKWDGPERVTFETLVDWTKRPETGIKYYSGKATYRKTFDLPQSPIPNPQSAIFLDLGTVRNIAAVRLNGKNLGIVWTAPWHVEITKAVKPTGNALEIDVVNLWPNRLIGDAGQPQEKRRTVTNVTGFLPDTPLLPSGLLGPVTVRVAR